MNAPVWRVEDDGAIQLSGAPAPEPGLVSLHFLVGAVRRRWRRVVLAAVAGACLALGLTQVVGAQPTATVTLLVVSDPTMDPDAAMATNLSLLRTRPVAQQVVENLHLSLSPERFLATVQGGELSNQLMTVTVTAPSSQEAIDRANELAAVYLTFRGAQISSSANSTIDANRERIDTLQHQIDDLTKRSDAAEASGRSQTALDLRTQRAQLQGEVAEAEDANVQTALQNRAIVGASHVVDSATAVAKSRIRRSGLAIASGLIGGTALGLGLVLTPAVLSTRLRRREDVARALGHPVRFSAGKVRSRRGWWFRGGQARKSADRLAHGLATALPDDADNARLTVATIGDVRDGAFVVGALADELVRESTRVAVVDLSSSNALARPSLVRWGGRDPIRNRQLIRVHRQRVRVSKLAGLTSVGEGSAADLVKADVVLTLIELDLGAGIDMLGDLAESCVVLVSAGFASAERLRSSSTLLRQSGIQPAFAMLVGADEMDDSSGLLAPFIERDRSTRRSS
jgi:capsular polysaccharide biosynthesis protein